jgi:hypothetical protein
VRPLLITLLLFSTAQATATTLYTHRFSDGVQAIQWVAAAGQLTGTLQTVKLTATGTHLSTATPLTGVQHGSQLALTFSSSFLGISAKQTILGTASSTGVVLNIPQASGGLAQVTYQSSTVAQYNALVAGVQAEAAHLVTQDEQRRAQQTAADKARRAQDAAQEDAEYRVRQQTQTVKAALDKVQTDLTDAQSLGQDAARQITDLRGAGQLFFKDLQELQGDYDTLKSDAQKAAQSRECYDVHAVQGYDLNQLTGYDLNQLTGYDTHNLATEVTHTEKLLTDLKARATTLTRAVPDLRDLSSANPLSTTAIPRTLPSQLQSAASTLQQTTNQLNNALAAARQLQTQTLNQAQQMIAEARQIAAKLTCTP